jgi:signal transduction histidine kinase
LAVNCGYALAIGMVPWLERRQTAFGSPPLRVRLAFLLATGVCLALILTSALATLVVEVRARGLADQAVRDSRDAVVLLLLLVMPLAIVGGVLLAGHIARPLGSLATAAGRLERSEGTLGLGPSTGVAEIDHLTAAFAELRGRLAERTEESARLAEELRARVDALADADRRKDEFLAMLGHELRNPLGAIVSSTALLRLQGVEPAARARALAIIERQTGVLVRMVDDLLDVSRITRGKVNLQLAPLDLREVVTRASEALRPQLEAKRHTLAVELPATALPVCGDATRLEQVAANLLANAAKYTPPGGHLLIGARQERGEVLLAVRDDGVGIARELLPRVFDLFVQGEQTLDRTASGLGIGLTLVQRVVALHGGSVEAMSDGPGTGTEVIVRLPVHLAALESSDTT